MKEITVSISGGGARGYAALYILNEIARVANITVIKGTSVGSIIGAYYCLYGKVMDLKDMMPIYRNLMSFKPYISLWDPAKVRALLSELGLDKDFSECSIPLYINATEIKSLKSVVFSEGNILDAIMASIALPPILPSYKIKNSYYLDGGFSKPYLDADVIIDLLEGSFVDYDINHNNIRNNVLVALMALIKNAKKQPFNSFVFKPFQQDSDLLNVFHYKRKDEFYEQGKKCWKEQANNFLRWLNEKKSNS